MYKLLVIFALVAYASAGVVAPYAYGAHAIAPAVSYAPTVSYVPSVSYHAPLAHSYANTYKVALTAPTVTKLVNPPVTKTIYASAPYSAYSAYSPYYGYASGYGHGLYGSYGLGYGYGHGLGYGYGHGYYH